MPNMVTMITALPRPQGLFSDGRDPPTGAPSSNVVGRILTRLASMMQASREASLSFEEIVRHQIPYTRPSQ